MAQRRHVLVLESEKLLAAGIYSLLVSRPEFDVTSTTLCALSDLLCSDCQELDVIIMDQEVVAANIAAVMKLVDCHPRARLLVLGLDNNRLHVFDKHIVQVERVDDFFALLRHSPSQGSPNGLYGPASGGK